jgi:hypothetical protein
MLRGKRDVGKPIKDFSCVYYAGLITRSGTFLSQASEGFQESNQITLLAKNSQLSFGLVLTGLGHNRSKPTS